jgi:hypothetical protein
MANPQRSIATVSLVTPFELVFWVEEGWAGSPRSQPADDRAARGGKDYVGPPASYHPAEHVV